MDLSTSIDRLGLALGLLAITASLQATGCTYQSDAFNGVSCNQEGSVSDGRQCSGGFWVGDEPLDAGVDDMSSDMEPDVPTDLDMPDDMVDLPDDCVPEDEATFCMRQTQECGEVTAPDNCGVMRTVTECNTCPSTSFVCTPENICECVPETDVQLCTDAQATCGDIPTVMDRCEAMRTLNCGSCMPGEYCSSNVCETVTLTPPGGGSNGDDFGRSITHDGNVLVVGAPGTDSDEGKVYVFERNENTRAWNHTITLDNPESAVDLFGAAVALDGDLLAVGAPGTGNQKGRAYVFRRADATTWNLVDTLDQDATQTNSRLGASIDVLGERVAVGMPRADAPGNTPSVGGGAVIFECAAGGDACTELDVVFASVIQTQSSFGETVQWSQGALLVGAPREDFGSEPSIDKGSVYVFEEAAGSDWQEQRNEFLSDALASDLFGTAIAADTNFLLISAPIRTNALTRRSGAVRIYTIFGTTLNNVQTLQLDDGEMFDKFGASVALLGDVLVVGATERDTGGTDAGSIFVFDASDPANPLPLLGELAPPGQNAGSELGTSVVAGPDFVAAGAPGARIDGDTSGAVYVFDIPTAPMD